MKHLFVFLLAITQARAQWVENFSDGDFTSNPAWSGSVEHFIVNPDGQLQLNNSVAGDSYLTTQSVYSSLDKLEWEILVKQNFAGSSSNFGRVYLVSSQADLSGSLDGYFLQFGESGGNDAIELFRQSGMSEVRICRGTDGFIAKSFSVRVKVTRDEDGLWEVRADLTGENNFLLQASGTDITHTASAFFGVRCKYTMGNATKFFYDDISVKTIGTIIDQTPPVVVNVFFNDPTSATVVFNEEVGENANTLSHYSIHSKTISSAVLESDKKTVRLSLSSPLTNGNMYRVDVSGVKDLAENVMAAWSAEVLYFQEVAAAFNDLVINELFPDPAPPEGLPEYEFVELYNRSEKVFDLKDWKISDGTTTGIFPSFIIKPKEYVIVTASAFVSAYAPFGKTIGLTFPSLNNSGDKISLLDKNDEKIDELQYSVSFYQDADKAHGGWTLERLNPDLDTNDKNNWRASVNSRGGTPGSENSVFGINPDNVPPVLEALVVKNKNQLTLQFSEKITPTKFEVNKGLGPPSATTLSEDGKTAELTFPDFENGVTYQLTFSVEDPAGNALSGVKDFRYFQSSPARYKDLIFSEIMSDPSPAVMLPEAEYIEIFNRSEVPLDLGGWTLSDATSTTLLSSFIIFPKEYLVLTSAAHASEFSHALGVTRFPSLSNSGEPLVLRNDGKVIDSIHYSPDWHKEADKKDGGWSLEIIDTENICGEGDNWESSEAEAGGTPGNSNSVQGVNPDLQPPRLIAVLPQQDRLTLTFNEKLEATLSVHHFALEPQAEITEAFFTDKELKKISLLTALQKNVLYKITARVSDCAGNEIQKDNSLTFALPEPPQRGEVVINEILFNPKTGGVDFVELYNHSSKYFNFKDWKMGNSAAASKDFSEELFAPDTYKILTSDLTILAGHYPKTKTEAAVICKLPSLPNNEGSFVLTHGQLLIDSIYYFEDQHHALLFDKKGVSLERISFEAASLDGGNWCSSGEGATPGYVNACSRRVTASEAEFWVEPDQFDPEFPGQNFSLLNYKFKQGGRVATVQVMDAAGREIKILASNQILSAEGSFRWDGDTHRGRKAESGYYFFWIEVIDLGGTVQVFRKRVVVSSR